MIEKQIVFDENSYFFRIVLRLEKSKESVYHRKYKKLDSVLAEIGGIAKALMMIGFVVCIPINQLFLHSQLSNSLFSFKQISSNQNRSSENKFKNNQEVKKNEEIEEVQLSMNNIRGQQTKNTPQAREIYETPAQYYQSDNFSDEAFPSSKFKQQEMLNIETYPSSRAQTPQSLINKTEFQFLGNTNQNIEMGNTQRSENLASSQIGQNNGNNLIRILSMHQILKSNSHKSEDRNNIENSDIVNRFYQQNNEMNPHQESEGQNQEKSQFQRKRKSAKRKQSVAMVKSMFSGPEKEEESRLNLKWSDYVRYYIWPFGDFLKKKKQIDYSVEKIYQHLDMLYIVKKLLELERLKQILLDEDQIKLIQFLPKPQIDVDEIDAMKSSPSNRESRSSASLKNITILSDVATLSEKEKAKQAFQALKNILKKQQMSDLDRKIIEMLDGQILENIENNMAYLKELDSQEDILNKIVNTDPQIIVDPQGPTKISEIQPDFIWEKQIEIAKKPKEIVRNGEVILELDDSDESSHDIAGLPVEENARGNEETNQKLGQYISPKQCSVNINQKPFIVDMIDDQIIPKVIQNSSFPSPNNIEQGRE